jgi:peptidoglycan/LPS O-acetylase OafA/YrhL
MKPLRHFDNLDALRFIAFFSVFCLHMVKFGLYFNGEAWYRWIEESLLSNGDLGVNFFFTLSGFLLPTCCSRNANNTGKINIGSFYARRFLRIRPLDFALVFVGFYVLPTILNCFPQANPFKPEISAHSLRSFRLLFGVSLVNFDLTMNSYPSPVLAVLWSILVEEQIGHFLATAHRNGTKEIFHLFAFRSF